MDTVQPRAFGTLLRRQRIAAGLTQEELAEQAGVSVRRIGDLERGVQQTPRRDTVALLAEALGLSAEEHAALEEAARQLRTPAPAGPARPDAATPPLVGRQRELALLERHLAEQGPPLLLLAGEPGIGKTRLLHAAIPRAVAQGWRVLEGGCQRRDGLEPFAPLLQALEGYLAQRPPAQRRTELQGCAWLVRLLPELAAGPIEPLPAWTLPPAQERRLMFGAVARFLANVAGPSGTLLLLDDLHWAGIDALDLLATLVRAPGGTPLRVIGAYRDTEVQAESPLPLLLADLAHAGLVDQVTLGPLDSQEILHLFDDLLENLGEVPGELREQVLQRAGGVPFFVVSYTRDLHANRREGGAATPVPWSMAQSIRQRVAVLPERARTLLSAASVVGRAIPRTLLGAILAGPEGDLLDALEAACQARLLTEEEHSYQFAHDVIREVIEADLSVARRTVLHRRIGEVLELSPGERPVEALAYHFVRGGAREQAVTYLEQAGDRAAARYAQVAAEGYYRALVISLDEMQRVGEAAAREKLGSVLRTMARYAEALAVLEQAAGPYQAAGDLESLGRVLAQIGHLHACKGTALEEGVARLQPLLEPLAARGPSHSLASLYSALALLRWVQGQLRESLAAATWAAEIARAVGDAGLLAAAELGRGTALISLAGDLDALPVLEEASLLAEAAGTLDTQGWALVRAARVHADRGEFDQWGRCAARAVTIAEQLGEPALASDATLSRGAWAFFSGSWTEAREHFARHKAPPGEMPKWDAPPLLELGRLDLAEGAWERAARYLEGCSALARRGGARILVQVAESLLAERDLLEHRPAAALARLLPLLDRGDMEKQVVTTYVLPVLAWAYLERGEMGPARVAIEDALRRARAGNYRLHLVNIRRVQALLAMREEDWPAAERALAEGLALARPMPYPHGEGRLLHVYGQMHAAKGEPEQARERLEAALAIFRRLGARKDVEHTEQLVATLS